MDPQSRPAKFSAARGLGLPRPGISPWTRTGRRAGPRRVHFSRAERYDRLRGRLHAGDGKVSERLARTLLQAASASRPGAEGRPRASRPPGSPGEFDWRGPGLSRARRPLLRDRTGLAGRASGSVASLSAFHPTRLETRTKESNMRASH